MPQTDSRGQGVPYATLSDKPNAQTMSKGIVDGVVDKLVMKFASASVRGATIPAPTAGMVSYLTDTKLLQFYDGDGWTTVAAESSAWTTVSLRTGWAHRASGEEFQYRLVNFFGETSLMFRGVLTPSYAAGGGLVSSLITQTALSAALRPSILRTILIPCSDTGSSRIALRLEVGADGHLRVIGTNSSDIKPAWIGFDGTFCSL